MPLANAELTMRAPEFLQVRLKTIAVGLALLGIGDPAHASKKRRRCRSIAAGNMARILVSMANSWA
jgi:hypothetical protein